MSSPDHLYVATNGANVKIGISRDPNRRSGEIGARIIKVYKLPYARQIESHVKESLAYAAVRGTSEWFTLTEAELLEKVRGVIRVRDDDEAMQRGIEPSRRRCRGEPEHQPPFELTWLDKPIVKPHVTIDIRASMRVLRDPRWIAKISALSNKS